MGYFLLVVNWDRASISYRHCSISFTVSEHFCLHFSEYYSHINFSIRPTFSDMAQWDCRASELIRRLRGHGRSPHRLTHYLCDSLMMYHRTQLLLSGYQFCRSTISTSRCGYSCCACHVGPYSTVWVKKSPSLGFSDIFPKLIGILVQLLLVYCRFLSTIAYRSLFNYLERWRSYDALSATT